MTDIKYLLNYKQHLEEHLAKFKKLVEEINKFDFDNYYLLLDICSYDTPNKCFADLLGRLQHEHDMVVDYLREKKVVDMLKELLKE